MAYGDDRDAGVNERRRPHSSSALTTPWAARSGWNSDALASKYASIGAVMVEMVVAQVGERGGIEAKPLDTGLRQARGTTPPSTAPCFPLARASAMIRCNTGASGVVRSPSGCRQQWWGARAHRRMSASRCVTVVLPLVPVTPTVTSAFAG